MNQLMTHPTTNKPISLNGELLISIDGSPIQFKAEKNQLQLFFPSYRTLQKFLASREKLFASLPFLKSAKNLIDDLEISYYLGTHLVAVSGPHLPTPGWGSYYGLKKLHVHKRNLLKYLFKFP